MNADDGLRHPVRAIVGQLTSVTGGRARLQVVVVLACVLGLDSADIGSIGSIAGKLEVALHLTNTELGVIVALPSLLTALATLPLGLLSDRINRVRLLIAGIIVWSLAEAASSASTGFVMLLMIRMAVGAGTAAAGPPLTSLVGDLVPTRDRAHIWGLILSGELLGAGFGFLLAGEAATIGSWRWAFLALAVPGVFVVWAVWKWLPEPARGGDSWLQTGDDKVLSAQEARRRARKCGVNRDEEFQESNAQQQVEKEQVPANQELVLRDDPGRMSLWQATVYVLRIPTNLVLILGSALGYFYFQGVETFAIVLIQGRYGLSHGAATLAVAAVGLGAIIGVIGSGILADRLLARGRVNARITLGGIGFLAAAILFFPGLMLQSIGPAMVFFILAGIAFGARNAPLDAARLDVMHHRLWGRAEGARTLLRRLMTTSAAVAFGAMADALASGPSIHGASGFGANASARGLWLTFLLLLLSVAAGGALTLRALKTYRRDMSTAVASEQATAASSSQS